MGNNEPYELIAERFNAAASSVHNVVRRVCLALVSNYRDTFIKWPKGQMLDDTIAAFERQKGFPGVVGAIDGTHTPIKAPYDNPNDYINRKQFHSIQLQIVTTYDYDLIITDAFCGFPGRVHDARVFRNSALFVEASQNHDDYFPGNTHLVCNSAYPILPWLLTPYRNTGNLTRRERNYNYRQSSTRMAVEHCCGTLKGQFWRLKTKFDIDIIGDAPVIVAACILHNICILNHEEILGFFEANDDDMDYDYLDVFPPNRDGQNKRNQIKDTLPLN